MRALWPALLIALVVVIPAVAVAEAPSITSQPSALDVLDLLRQAIRDARIQNGLQDGDVITVRHGSSSPQYTYSGGALASGATKAGTIVVTIDGAALVSIVNAYDQTNSAKLAIKNTYITVTSSRAGVQTAVSLIQKTGAGGEAMGVAPKVGDGVSYKGCTGTIAAADNRSSGKLIVALCGSDYAVDALGGITTKLPPPHLQPSSTVTTKMNLTSSSLNTGSTGVQPATSKDCGQRPTLPTTPPTGSRSSAWNAYFSEVKTYQRNLLAYSLCVAEVS